MSSENMRTCANCGSEVREGARFCASCGAPVELADRQPSPAEPQPITSSTRKRRLVWVAAGTALALLVAGAAGAAVLAMTGGDGPTQGLPLGGETTGASDATGVDCEELTSFADYAPALAAVQSNPAASPDEIEEVMEALSELASGAPDDVRQDFETMSATMQEMARAVSELGLEPGDIPNEEQTDLLLELAADMLDDTEYLDAATSVAAWFETAVAQCSSTGTETTESGDTTFGDETTNEAEAFGDERVEETCDGILVYATALNEDIPNPTVEDVERVAAIVAELADSAPAEDAGTILAGQPKESLEDTAAGIETLARLLSVLGLDPGSDAALAEPRIAEVNDGLAEANEDLEDWFETRCSEEDQAALERIRNG